MKKKKLKVLDLFAGCGGFSLGFSKAGHEIVGFVESWPPAIDTFLKNHPKAEHLGYDIRVIGDIEIERFRNKIDVIIGGPPCQGFSTAGKRDPKDKRNQLYKEFLRFVRIIKPRIVLLENVKGLKSMIDSDGEKILDKIINEFIKEQYFVCWKVLKAVEHCVPQKRERLILVAKKPDSIVFDFFSKIKIKPIDALKDLPCKECPLNGHVCFDTTKENIAKIKKLKQGERLLNYNLSRQRIYSDEPAPTIVTKPLFVHPIYDRLMTPRELARLQTFPDYFEFCGSKTSMVKQIGNAVPPRMAYFIARSIEEEIPCE